jgi:hypothetical protein
MSNIEKLKFAIPSYQKSLEADFEEILRIIWPVGTTQDDDFLVGNDGDPTRPKFRISLVPPHPWEDSRTWNPDDGLESLLAMVFLRKGDFLGAQWVIKDAIAELERRRQPDYQPPEDAKDFLAKYLPPKPPPEPEPPPEPPPEAGSFSYKDVVAPYPEEKSALIPRPWVWRDPATIPTRKWLCGTLLMRGCTTTLGGSGGVGKTSIEVAVLLACLTQRSNILNQKVFEPGLCVWINVLEDDMDELDRRIHAGMKAHNVSRSDIEGRLFINTAGQSPVILARLNPENGAFQIGTDAKALEDGIRDMRIDVTAIDPLLKAHRVIENSNEQMEQLLTITNNIAGATNSALLVPCHFRKGGGEGGNRDAFRGGGSLIDTARINRAVTNMDANDIKLYQPPPDESFRFVKLTDAKGNMAPKDRTIWFELKSVALGNVNVDPFRPNGDNVQAAVPWETPKPFDGLDYPTLDLIFATLRLPPKDEEGKDAVGWRYSTGSRAKYRVANVIIEIGKSTPDQAATVIKTWQKNGVISEVDYKNPNDNKAKGIELNEAKVDEIMAPWYSTATTDADWSET